MLYQPPTRQQEKSTGSSASKKEGVVEVRPEDDLESGEIVSEPVQIPKVKLSPERFNTQNLQDELRKNMVRIMESDRQGKGRGQHGYDQEARGEIPYLQIPAEEPLPQDTIEMPHIETDAEIDNSLKSNLKSLQRIMTDRSACMFRIRGTTEPQVTGQMRRLWMRCLVDWEKNQACVGRRRFERGGSSASWNPRRRVHCRGRRYHGASGGCGFRSLTPTDTEAICWMKSIRAASRLPTIRRLRWWRT